MTTTTFKVTGMSCGHCVDAVSGELGRISGVAGVTVDLVTGGVSLVTVTSTTPLDGDAVRTAVDEAGGYQVVAG